MLSIGMLLHRLTRKEQIISYVSPDKHKHMNGLPSQLKVKDKLVLKCKKKVYLLIQEMISQYSLKCISIHKCGNKEEMRLLFLYKG